jgi:cytoskeletal protein RodZ
MKENPFNLQPEQIEKLKEIGSHLRQYRQKHSISLDDVAAKTCIQARLLNAIEESNISILPEPVYIKGFIKQYANALGLNGAELASGFPTWQTMLLIKPSWQHLPTPQLRPIHLYLFYIFLVIGAVNGLSSIVSQSAIQVSNAQTYRQQQDQGLLKDNQAPATSAQNLEPVLKDNQAPPASAQNLESVKITEVSKQTQTDNMAVKVSITAKSSSWLRIVADGKTEFEGTLEEGDQRTWEAKEQLTVRAGNAGGILVAVNNEKAEELGAPKEVKERTFEANHKS